MHLKYISTVGIGAASSGRLPFTCCLLVWAAASGTVSIAQPVVFSEPVADAVIRRTDIGNDGPVDPGLHRLPDVIETRLGTFSPAAPHLDRFNGSWDSNGQYMRFDMVFDGLVNPPGPLSLEKNFPVYEPFLYGPNPAFGYVEFDMDANPDTGGELSDTEYRYLGNVGRFGGLPSDARFLDRAAVTAADCDENVLTAPYVERSGEEFHLALTGEEIDSISIKTEMPGGNPMVFEDGETWVLEGDFFHRAHGFEDYAFTCFDRPGRYKPEVKLQFKHDVLTERTTVSLVYPLTNAADAALQSPGTPVEPNDGCEDNQNSVEEALEDLQISAEFADPWDRMQPDFALIAGWEFNVVANLLVPENWPSFGLVGTAYEQLQGPFERFIWTDAWPNPLPGDFDGSGVRDAADVALLIDFIAANDGVPGVDDDGNGSNGVILWRQFSRSFTVFDTNYDGIVELNDAVIMGDMDLNQAVEFDDVDDFVQALLTPDLYAGTHGGVTGVTRGDINSDLSLDAADIAGFLNILLNP